MVRITRIMASFGTASSANYLISKLDHLNKDVITVAVKGLQKIDKNPDENEKAKIFAALYSLAGITAWNISARYSLKDYMPATDLIQALEDEIKENFDLIYTLLSIAYDSSSVYHIRKNLESGTSEGIGFAIELMEIFIDESVKPYLFPLLDDTAVAEKIRQLQSEFPVEIMKPEELLLSVINRDYNQINPYTRVCALHCLQEIDNFTPGQDIIAQMFNPDALIREEASILIFRFGQQRFKEVLGRLPVKYRNNIESYCQVAGTSLDCGLFRKFNYLKESEFFGNFKNHRLIHMARRFDLINIQGEEERLFSDFFKADQFILVAEGELKITKENNLYSFSRGEFIDAIHFSEMENASKIVNGIETRLLILDKTSLQELVFDDENTFFPVAEMISLVNHNKNTNVN
jgi:hypothetical protein